MLSPTSTRGLRLPLYLPVGFAIILALSLTCCLAHAADAHKQATRFLVAPSGPGLALVPLQAPSRRHAYLQIQYAFDVPASSSIIAPGNPLSSPTTTTFLAAAILVKPARRLYPHLIFGRSLLPPKAIRAHTKLIINQPYYPLVT